MERKYNIVNLAVICDLATNVAKVQSGLPVAGSFAVVFPSAVDYLAQMKDIQTLHCTALAKLVDSVLSCLFFLGKCATVGLRKRARHGLGGDVLVFLKSAA